MSFRPLIIFDKSTIQGLSNIETEKLKKHLRFVVTPPLIREIRANLHDSKSTTEELCSKVSIMANKLLGSDPIFQYPIESIVIADLLGDSVRMDGTPFLSPSEINITKDGISIEESQSSLILKRLANQNFVQEDYKIAEFLRLYHQSVDLNEYKENLNKTLNPPRFESLEQCNEWIKAILNTVDQNIILDFLMQLINCSENNKNHILKRWDIRRSSLKEFSKSGFWYLNNILFLCFGLSSNLIPSSKRDKASIDLEYITYLPYSNGMSSQDRLFKTLYDIFSRADQIFLTGNDIKIRLEEIDKNERDTLF